jgi:hypothetical protein
MRWLPFSRWAMSCSTLPAVERHLSNGYSFRVVQYWNRCDFYSTELHVTSPDGQAQLHTLDGDDSKSRHVPLVINEQARTATVTLGGGRVKQVDW